MATYSELLKRHEWHKRREEIMRLAGWKCEDCGRCLRGCDRCEYHDDGFVDHLEAHHRYYQRGKMPWDYPDIAFLCLCRECHQERTLREEVLKIALGLMTQLEQEDFIIKAKDALAACVEFAEVHGDRNPYLIFDNLKHLPAELHEAFYLRRWTEHLEQRRSEFP